MGPSEDGGGVLPSGGMADAAAARPDGESKNAAAPGWYVRGGCMCCGKERRNGLPLLPCTSCRGGYCTTQCQKDDFYRHRRDCNSPVPPGLKPTPAPHGIVVPPFHTTVQKRGSRFTKGGKGSQKAPVLTEPRPFFYCTQCYKHLFYCKPEVCESCNRAHFCESYYCRITGSYFPCPHKGKL